MKSLSGHAGPQPYLDARFTHEQADATSKVLRSALVRNSVYYAAVERRRTGTDEREVWALVCLVEFNARAPDGYVFGYKDMCESMGPYESDCPKAILDLLTPTDNPYAQAWRDRCQENIVQRLRSRAAG